MPAHACFGSPAWQQYAAVIATATAQFLGREGQLTPKAVLSLLSIHKLAYKQGINNLTKLKNAAQAARTQAQQTILGAKILPGSQFCVPNEQSPAHHKSAVQPSKAPQMQPLKASK